MSTNGDKSTFYVERLIRLVFMVLFGLVLQLAAMVMWLVVVVQFVHHLFIGQRHDSLAGFAASLAHYIYQCWQFLNDNTDTKPFPFNDWPDDKS